MTVNARIKGQTITWSGGEPAIVADSIGFVEFMFEFSDDWNTYDKVAQFKHGGKTYNMLLSEDKCLLPAEVKSGICSVSVFGYIAGSAERGTTTELIFYVTPSGFDPDGSTPIPPTPDLYAQLLDTISNEHIADAVYEYLTKNPPPKGDKGDPGEKGEQGEPGKPGKDGVDGVDGKDGRDGVDLKAYVSPTASGSIVNFGDGAEDIPVKSLAVDIEPVQDLNGYDAPWPPGGGKNLLDLENAYVTGWNITNIPNLLQPDTEYYFSVIDAGGIPTGFYACRDAAGNEPLRLASSYYPSGSGSAFTTPTDVGEYPFLLLAGSKAGLGEIFPDVKFQVELGSTATAYAPYSNICPISGWTGAKVTRTGENLFDAGIIHGLWANGVLYQHTSTRYCAGDKKIPIKPGTYILSYKSELGISQISYDNFSAGKFVNNTTYWSFGSTYTVITIPEGIDEIGLTLAAASEFTGDVPFSDVQLELGSTATAYEPYQGNTYDISFPDEAGTVYGGTLDVTTGLLTVDKRSVILDGSEYTYTPNGVTAAASTVYVRFADKKPGRTNMLSDKFRVYIGEGGGPFSINGRDNLDGIEFLLPIEIPQISSAIRDWFAANATQLVYELATPITYQLTPTEVTTLLGVNNIWADTGDVDVTYRADPTLIYNKLTAAIAALSTNLADADAALNELGVI